MGSFYILLQKIREKPGLCLGGKSLECLQQFHYGYSFREMVDAWEKWTGRDFFENYDEAMRSWHKMPWQPSDSFLDGFNKFVHSHYGREMGAMSSYCLISSKSGSEEEAFDKYFELLDDFLKESQGADLN